MPATASCTACVRVVIVTGILFVILVILLAEPGIEFHFPGLLLVMLGIALIRKPGFAPANHWLFNMLVQFDRNA